MVSLSGPGPLLGHAQHQGVSFTLTIALDLCVYHHSCLLGGCTCIEEEKVFS